MTYRSTHCTKYLTRFLDPENSTHMGGSAPTKPTKPPSAPLESDVTEGESPYETYETASGGDIFTERWGPGLSDSTPGIDFTPPAWRLTVAGLPHDEWVWWRARSTEIQAALGHPPSADEIRASDHAAALEVPALPASDVPDEFFAENLKNRVLGDINASLGAAEAAGWPRGWRNRIGEWTTLRPR